MYVEDIALKTGQILNNQYVLEEVYYVGHTSIVYLGRDKKHDEKIMVKEYCPHRMANRDMDGKSVICRNECKQQYIQAYKAFQKEIEIVKKLKGLKKPYPDCVIQYVDSFVENNTMYLITELVKGKSMEEYISEGKNYSIRTSMLSLVKIVEQIHRMGILHRDIKPANIMIQPDGRVTLIDFGSACFRSDKEEQIQFVSRGYSAPELYNGGKSNRQTDVYSIGAVLYYILTDFQIPPVNELEEGESIPSISEFRAVPQKLEKAVMKAIEPQQNKRVGSLSQLKFILMT
ncbi:MAG: serine/threonine protein kinase [Lachnospiraceae bacterium]|nr:serine/threonine protein kinase [Lachnospiraceae bacterium]